MTTREKMSLIDNAAMLAIHPLSVPVTIKDVKEAFGRTDCLVVPIGGAGQQWVSFERLTLQTKAGVQ
jgi:hypothetical protein